MRAAAVGLWMWFVIFAFAYLGWGGWRIYNAYNFEVGCSGHLKRAADANTIPLAKKELGIAVEYLTANCLTEGSTAVFFHVPSADIGFLYTNLSAALDELDKIDLEKASNIEKSNMLIKLRETILDSGKGDSITLPHGISVFPYNKSQFFFSWITGLGAIVFGCWAFFVTVDGY